ALQAVLRADEVLAQAAQDAAPAAVIQLCVGLRGQALSDVAVTLAFERCVTEASEMMTTASEDMRDCFGLDHPYRLLLSLRQAEIFGLFGKPEASELSYIRLAHTH